MTGPGFGTWGEAVTAFFADLVADLDDAGLDSADVKEMMAAADKYQAVLNEVTEPRLLHGDLWAVNIMMASDAPEPTITGVFENDRTSWGDPESDRTIFMAATKPGTERDTFWETYGLGRPRPARPAGRCSTSRNTSARSAWSGTGWATRTQSRRPTSRCGKCSTTSKHESRCPGWRRRTHGADGYWD
ncbi:phosphotransferase [Saccharopolyspora hattusasensis]|uniref:phosphotransferase n=1 Tax=Saccharopolyspora hattusasensis TaxID=1128679 RepID=UPI003D9617B1